MNSRLFKGLSAKAGHTTVAYSARSERKSSSRHTASNRSFKVRSIAIGKQIKGAERHWLTMPHEKPHTVIHHAAPIKSDPMLQTDEWRLKEGGAFDLNVAKLVLVRKLRRKQRGWLREARQGRTMKNQQGL